MKLSDGISLLNTYINIRTNQVIGNNELFAINVISKYIRISDTDNVWSTYIICFLIYVHSVILNATDQITTLSCSSKISNM